jgi:hypothetical protein
MMAVIVIPLILPRHAGDYLLLSGLQPLQAGTPSPSKDLHQNNCSTLSWQRRLPVTAATSHTPLTDKSERLYNNYRRNEKPYAELQGQAVGNGPVSGTGERTARMGSPAV